MSHAPRVYETIALGQQQRLVVNLTDWQSLLELLDARVGDLSVAEVQRFQFEKTLQVQQSHIGDLSALLEVKAFETSQSLEVRQSDVGDMCIFQVQERQVAQSPAVH